MKSLTRRKNRIRDHITHEQAKALGADCDNCPLNESIPVLPRYNKNPVLVQLGEGPGGNEEFFNEPFVGETGRKMDDINEQVGGARAVLHITNAMLCRSRPGIKLSAEDWNTAVACCRPRLAKELTAIRPQGALVILALGGKAQQAVTGKAKIMEWMGAPLPGALFYNGKAVLELPKKAIVAKHAIHDFRAWTVLSTLHPAYASRGKPEWYPVIAIHTQRAWKLAWETLEPFVYPTIIVGSKEPVLVEVLKTLLAKATKLGCDVETAGLDPKSDLLNIGFGSKALMLAVSIDWQTASNEVKDLAKEICKEPTITKVMHNGQFDVIVLENN